jgi:hypothetical protein
MAPNKLNKVTQREMAASYQQVRKLLGSSGSFSRSLRHEFDIELAVRDFKADMADDLIPVLDRQLDAALDPHMVRADAIHLVALAEGIHALACLQCNGVMRLDPKVGRSFGSWTDADERMQESTRTSLVQAMNATLSRYKARIGNCYGDPRGHVVHIEFADGSSNRGSEKVWGL